LPTINTASFIHKLYYLVTLGGIKQNLKNLSLFFLIICIEAPKFKHSRTCCQNITHCLEQKSKNIQQLIIAGTKSI